MQTSLYQYNEGSITIQQGSDIYDGQFANLVLCFGSKQLLADGTLFNKINNMFPLADIAMCSTSGEICNLEVFDNTATVTAIKFSKTQTAAHAIDIGSYNNSFDAGAALMGKFDKGKLVCVLVLSDGSRVNGSELVRGLNSTAGTAVLVTGGLAGDGNNFHSTLVGLNKQPSEGVILGVGFYGDSICVGHGTEGGWEMFGLEKTVTKAESNILYEIDHLNALGIYKKYLGSEASLLPGSALLFPLAVTLPESGEQVVRTILSINEANGSMTFAGDIPMGAKVRFMKANFDKITHAAAAAATAAMPGGIHPKLALLISCVGRKIILQSRIEEEVEAVAEIFGNGTIISGFYSYGEISPLVDGGACQLHNQTMTITTFYETE